MLGTIENEGPVVVKTHLAKLAKGGGVAEELSRYRNELEEIKHTFDLLRHPNVMPYQGLILDNVLFWLRNMVIEWQAKIRREQRY